MVNSKVKGQRWSTVFGSVGWTSSATVADATDARCSPSRL